MPQLPPATPAKTRAVYAVQIAKKLAAYHLAESVLGDEVARQHALARAIEATEAKRREIAARLDQLEAAQPRSEEHAPD